MTLLTPKITASTDSSLIARGEYLVYGPAHCAFCHAPISEFPRLNAGEKVSMTGGFDFVLPVGVVYAPNITPDEETGIGAFTDKELARAMCHGVKRNGQAKFEVIDERGQIVKGKHFVTPNLTPDPETGRMALWNEEVFITRFRAGTVIPGTPIPWGPYSRMTDLELKALFKYLHSLQPVHAATPVGIQEGDPY